MEEKAGTWHLEPDFIPQTRLTRDRYLFYAALGLVLLGVALVVEAGVAPQLLPVAWDTNGIVGSANLFWISTGVLLAAIGGGGIALALRGGVVRLG